MLTPQEVAAAWGLHGIDRETLERLHAVAGSYGRQSIKAMQLELAARTQLKNTVEAGCSCLRSELFMCGQAMDEAITGDCPPKDIP